MIPVKLCDLSPEARKQIQRVLRSMRLNGTDSVTAPVKQEAVGKWHNVRTTVDGISFASKREASRYAELKMELIAGEITDLELQKPFSLDVNGVHICDYIADFVYRRDGVPITEDAKGKATDLYVIKHALMRALYDIEIVEV